MLAKEFIFKILKIHYKKRLVLYFNLKFKKNTNISKYNLNITVKLHRMRTKSILYQYLKKHLTLKMPYWLYKKLKNIYFNV